MSPECPSLKYMQMQIIWSFEYGTQWSIVQLSALRWKANRMAHWRKADNEGPSATQQLISFLVISYQTSFPECQRCKSEGVCVKFTTDDSQQKHPGDNSSDRVITSIIDILYSMMVQVCEGLRFDLPFFLPDVQNT